MQLDSCLSDEYKYRWMMMKYGWIHFILTLVQFQLVGNQVRILLFILQLRVAFTWPFLNEVNIFWEFSLFQYNF